MGHATESAPCEGGSSMSQFTRLSGNCRRSPRPRALYIKQGWVMNLGGPCPTSPLLQGTGTGSVSAPHRRGGQGLSAGWREKSRQHLDGHRLPCAVRPEQREDLSRFNRKRQGIDGCKGPEPPGERPGFNDRHALLLISNGRFRSHRWFASDPRLRHHGRRPSSTNLEGGRTSRIGRATVCRIRSATVPRTQRPMPDWP